MDIKVSIVTIKNSKIMRVERKRLRNTVEDEQGKEVEKMKKE